MTARQEHGFSNEYQIKDRYGLLDYDDTRYTARFDAKHADGKPVSIKTKKNKSAVELGDYWRNVEINQDFYLVVTFWKSSPENIVEELHMLIPADEWSKLFDRSFDDRIRALIDNASNDYSYDPIWRVERKKLQADYGKRVIRLRPKRDHKTQKRMQCAISYADLLDLHSKYSTDRIKTGIELIGQPQGVSFDS